MAPNLDLIGKLSGPYERSWNSRHALLYTTENSIGVEQRVLPTYAVMIGGTPVDYRAIGEIDVAKLVHGEQSFRLHSPIPVAGVVHNTGKVIGIYDKGSGMVIAAESTSVLVETGEPLITTTSSVFIRGAGWGGDRGPSGPKNVPPRRGPDHSVTYQTRIDQALTYRLSGDRNPLHSDPEFAKLAGFPRPILHGLCTFGFTGRALLHTLARSDDRRFTGMEARFAKPVFPGQALTVKIWQTGPGEAVYTTENDNGEVVISEGRATFIE
jgi:acyl dehydratase